MAHEKLQQRRLHQQHRRQVMAYGGDEVDSPGAGSGDDPRFLTGPVTIVVTRTISRPLEAITSVPVQAPTLLPTTSINRYPYISSSSSETQLSSPTVGPAPAEPTDAPASAPSIANDGAGGSDNQSTQVPEPVSGSTRPPSSLPSGAVIGIVIAGITLLIALIVYFVRRRYVQRRIRLRKDWAQSKSLRPGPVTTPAFATPIADTYASQRRQVAPFDDREPEQMQARNPLAASLPPLVIPPPPTSYGMEYTALSPSARPIPYATSAPPKSTSPTKKLLTPVYGPPSAVLETPVVATVVSTFITTLPDELQITVGESIHILSEFDDGWAMCTNAKGEQGMVPLECLDNGGLVNPENVTRTLGGNLKRISSLQPQLMVGRRF
ncbi:hypothetical protein CC1G_13848 [Coprinopsis cinerea okayama7|uniref:SH3 domain-containing protein n=1 Tax=Coprinopsis cinerea (strain Okayama-7 / 130 / ATCC MYA-4618 / FGSC 9003) TaxID=240176 RepID=D6RKL0_COPC7|nr:hypothetical protein CC1G_13848 [Coprinopsis cinerea okayama7\|eukprot:XP_002911813.1 hypothetical protein CC1G_13848 [Coprinopsis cinerea okayama7\